MVCPSEFSDLLTGFLPAIIVAGLVTTLATSHDSGATQRATALVVASATHALYSIGDLLFDDTDFHVVTVSDSGSDTWITDIYKHFLIFDIALVAAGAAQLWKKIEVTEYAWTIAAVASIVGHSIGVLIGNIAELPVIFTAIMTTGALDGLGKAIADVLDFLPEALQVSRALTHVLLSSVLYVVSLILDDIKYEFKDIIKEETVIVSAVAIVVVAILELTEQSVEIGRVLTVAALVLSYIATTMGTDELTELAPTACEGDKFEVAAAAYDGIDAGRLYTLIGSAALASATLAMAVADNIPKYFMTVGSVERGMHGHTRGMHTRDCEAGAECTVDARCTVKPGSALP
tara:strand:- start:1399 stop:2436 length:1038 start_codon:yes stop_codon:yes gene_type:complete